MFNVHLTVFCFIYSMETLWFSAIKQLEKSHTDFPSCPFSLLKFGFVTTGWVQNPAGKETGDSKTVTSKQGPNFPFLHSAVAETASEIHFHFGCSNEIRQKNEMSIPKISCILVLTTQFCYPQSPY